MELGPVGIWSRELRFGAPAQALEAAADLEELGFGTLWIPGGLGGPLLESSRMCSTPPSDASSPLES